MGRVEAGFRSSFRDRGTYAQGRQPSTCSEPAVVLLRKYRVRFGCDRGPDKLGKWSRHFLSTGSFWLPLVTGFLHTWNAFMLSE